MQEDEDKKDASPVADTPASEHQEPDSVPANDEDKAIEQIEQQNEKDHLDDLYEQQSDPSEPLIVLGDEKHKWLAHLKRPAFWLKLFLVLLVVLVFTWLVTPSRLWLLNLFGQRTTLTVTSVAAIDSGTPPILKNATITINGTAYYTNDQGVLNVAVPYGQQHIVVSKQGYQSITKDELLDFDPFFHYLGGKQADLAARNLEFSLKSVGVSINFTAKDWLSGLPITIGKFGIGDVVATPDQNGKVSLTIPATDAKSVLLNAVFTDTYANTTVTINLPNTQQQIAFVPAGRDYFVSKRSGNFGVYSANLDGSSVVEVVAPSVNETAAVAFSQSPSGKLGVLASSREATHDSFGSLQQKLYIVDPATAKLTSVDSALQFNFVDWQGDVLVYVATVHDASGATVKRLASINVATGAQNNLVTQPGIKVARLTLNRVLYLTGAGELHVIGVQGGTDKNLGAGASNLTQTGTYTFAYQSNNVWAQYNANTDQTSSTNVPTSTTRSFVATASGDGQTQLVVDTIDGKLALIAKTVADGQEKTLYTGNDLAAPIHWVGNVAVYRVGASDYAISPLGGAAKKITDVNPALTTNNDYFSLN